jgi:hypothetical protein
LRQLECAVLPRTGRRQPGIRTNRVQVWPTPTTYSMTFLLPKIGVT